MAMAGYGKKKNMALSTDEETVYHDQVAKTWHRHFADAHRHMAIAYNYMIDNESKDQLVPTIYTGKKVLTKDPIADLLNV